MLAPPVVKQVALDIPFRGGRDYVHSTDLFAALEDLAGDFSASRGRLKSLTLRRRAYRQVVVDFRPPTDAFGSFALALPDQILNGWLAESAAPITRHIEFDEARISQAAISEPGRVILPTPVKGFSPFEQTVVLFKMLCAQIHSGAWLFTGIDLDRTLSAHASLAVSHIQTVLGRLVDARVDQDNRIAGRLRMVLAAGENS